LARQKLPGVKHGLGKDLGFAIDPDNLPDVEVGSSLYGFSVKMYHTEIIIGLTFQAKYCLAPGCMRNMLDNFDFTEECYEIEWRSTLILFRFTVREGVVPETPVKQEFRDYFFPRHREK